MSRSSVLCKTEEKIREIDRLGVWRKKYTLVFSFFWFGSPDGQRGKDLLVKLCFRRSWTMAAVLDKVNANFVQSEFGKFNPSEEVSECQVT